MNKKITYTDNMSIKKQEKILNSMYKQNKYTRANPFTDWHIEQKINKAISKCVYSEGIDEKAFVVKTHPKLEEFVSKFCELPYVKNAFMGMCTNITFNKYKLYKKNYFNEIN